MARITDLQHKKWLKEPKYRKAYEALEEEFVLAEAVMDVRNHAGLTQQELAQITDLVKESMGYSKERGDTLNVANSPFTVPETEVVAETPFWKQPATYLQAKDIIKQLLIAGVAIFLVLGVLRPLLKDLAKARADSMRTMAAGGDGQLLGEMPMGMNGHEQNLESVKQLARQEPKLVASVVKNWVAE